MIHSLAGGNLGKVKFADFAKVQLLEGSNKNEIYWYVTKITLIENDVVLVPFGKNNALVKARVLRVDKNVSSQVSPIPFSHAKEVYNKIVY